MESEGSTMLRADVEVAESASSSACGSGARAALSLRAPARDFGAPAQSTPRARSTRPEPRPKPGAVRGNTRSVKPEPRVRPNGARSSCVSTLPNVEPTPQVRNEGSGNVQHLEAVVGETEAQAGAPLVEGALTGTSTGTGRHDDAFAVPCDQDRAELATVSDALGDTVTKDTSEQLNGTTQTFTLDDVLGASADTRGNVQTGANPVHYPVMLELPDISDFSDSTSGDELDGLNDLDLL
eukprot:TRINITY_DN6332_c0_g3_i3.p1 TRINITY_DN6332_c0_g3~~TRINITY_DN6332_c0_g3_i3.p1  ORF type:complete len:238 (+),score=31.42 TRINITY_DN6332_c0_g3_i3:43-756(+)